MYSGINVLDNKSELRKEIDRRKHRQQQRDEEEKRRLDRRSSFELRLEQQASKLHPHRPDNLSVESTAVIAESTVKLRSGGPILDVG